MANIEEILGRQINSVKELKSAISDLQNSLIGLDSESEEFKTTSQQLAAAQEELTKVTKAGKEENIAATDSIVGMQQEYKKLYDQYKMLSEEQRNSDFGKNMATSLDQLSTKMNEVKQGAGNFKDNIGRYAGDIGKAFDQAGVSIGALQGPLKIANLSFKGLNATMKANPVGLVIAAIMALIAIFKKVKDAVGQNEELQMRWNEAMAKFQPIVDTAKKALNFLAEIFVKYIEFISKAVQKVREFGAAVTDFLGITKGRKKQIQEQQKIYDDIVKSTNQLTKNKREYQKLNAKDQAEVESLREAASATQDKAERTKLLQEAKEKQAVIDARNLEIAKEELRILEEQATLTANDAAMNDKLAAATAKVAEMEALAAKNANTFNKQINAASSGLNGATTATKNYREEAKKLYADLIENNKTELQKVTEKYEKEKKLLEKYHYDTKLLTKKYNEDVAKIAKEQADKEKENYKQERERRTNRLKQVRSDTQQEINLNERVDKELAMDQRIEDMETAVQKLRNLQAAVKRVGDSLIDQSALPDMDKALEKSKEFYNTLLEKGFEGLDDKYKNIREYAEDINSTFGLAITNAQNLGNEIDRLKEDIIEAKGERAQLRVDIVVGDSDIANLNTELDKILNNSFSEYTIEVARNAYESLDVEKRALEEELTAFEGTQDQKIEMLRRYYEVVKEMRDYENELFQLNQERTWQMVENLIDATDSIGAALGTIKSSYETLVDSELKAGKIDEEQARKKKKRMLELEKVQTAFSIATIVADAAAGIFSVWKGYAAEVGTINPQTAAAAGPAGAGLLTALNTKSLVTAIAKTTSLAATATAQIMAARNGVVASANNFSAESGGSSVSVGATPALIDSNPYSYTRTVQTQEEEDALNRPIWVSVEDISSALGQQVTVKDESSF